MNKLRILYDGVDNTITVMAKESDNPPIGLLDRTEGQMAFWGNRNEKGGEYCGRASSEKNTICSSQANFKMGGW